MTSCTSSPTLAPEAAPPAPATLPRADAVPRVAIHGEPGPLKPLVARMAAAGIVVQKRPMHSLFPDGAIDAIVCPRTPRAYKARDGVVRRLFEDFETVEKAYYRKTKIFPIMHVIGIRREIYEKHPWIARNLYQAFSEAKRISQADLFETAALRIGLPWLVSSAEGARRLIGDDVFPYGYESSLPSLDAMSRYMTEQFIAVRRVDPEELFPATTMVDPKT